MRRITLWALSTLTTLVLLFSYHTSTGGSGTASAAGTSVQAPAAAGSGTTDSGTASTDSGTTDSGTTDSGTTSGSAASKTYDGDTVQTRWGPVQVRITVVDGKITASEAIVYPNGNHEDEQINSFALPVLNQEAVSAQSASIDMVSGATVTSEGYLSSLQSAIDQAHL
ncbi:FMN-binding protein [Phycicoccus sp. Soil802]|uniref:FMN-binding protein n=1 Tax=Phycicoccus sp. Soil802 TaxID=1736414 RepID=UPI0007037D73|nr:FMN-binding protein [Phycicoccus sp. Soil802]KRF27934.1 FMN-binding protein [Phycicoccus sp. Soil802]